MVSIRIPLSVVIAGTYKVALSPETVVTFKEAKQIAARDFKIGDLVTYIGPGFLTYNPRLVGRIQPPDREGHCTVAWNNGTTTACEPQSLQHVHSQKEMFASSLLKTAVSLPELVQQTNAFSTKHRPGCVPVLEKSDPKSLFLQYRVTCHNEDYNDPNGHQTRVQFAVDKIKEDQNANDLDIQCTCSCPAFLYWGAQWNLHQRDGLLGEPRPLLQAPTERLDLRSNFVICKHCKAVFERILPSVQHNINNIIRKKKVEEAKRRREEEAVPPPTIKRRPGKPPTPTEEVEELEELAREEQEKMLEQEGIVGRETPATTEEKKKHPTLEKKPRWREILERLRERVKGWGVPTPEKKKEEPLSEDEQVQQELLREERRKMKMPLTQKHPETPHVDKGLPYKPHWRSIIDRLKNRIRSWGKK